MARDQEGGDPGGVDREGTAEITPAGRAGPPEATKWKKGQSGNPGGRPIGLVRYIRQQTDNLQELVDIALEIARNAKARRKDRLTAIQLILDRALGKPHASISIDAEVKHDVLEILSATPEQRSRRLLELEARRRAQLGQGSDDSEPG